jgi:hypothetical protein
MPTPLIQQKPKSPSIYWSGIVGISILQATVLFAVSAVVFNHRAVATSSDVIQTLKAD